MIGGWEDEPSSGKYRNSEKVRFGPEPVRLLKESVTFYFGKKTSVSLRNLYKNGHPTTLSFRDHFGAFPGLPARSKSGGFAPRPSQELGG